MVWLLKTVTRQITSRAIRLAMSPKLLKKLGKAILMVIMAAAALLLLLTIASSVKAMAAGHYYTYDITDNPPPCSVCGGQNWVVFYEVYYQCARADSPPIRHDNNNWRNFVDNANAALPSPTPTPTPTPSPTPTPDPDENEGGDGPPKTDPPIDGSVCSKCGTGDSVSSVVFGGKVYYYCIACDELELTVEPEPEEGPYQVYGWLSKSCPSCEQNEGMLTFELEGSTWAYCEECGVSIQATQLLGIETPEQSFFEKQLEDYSVTEGLLLMILVCLIGGWLWKMIKGVFANV